MGLVQDFNIPRKPETIQLFRGDILTDRYSNRDVKLKEIGESNETTKKHGDVTSKKGTTRSGWWFRT
jgi:hypothetical protein